MKKIIISIISAIVLLGACTKVEEERFDSMTNAITFNANGGVATKAIVEGTTMVDNFGVYGYVVPGDYSQNGGYLMKNAEYNPQGNSVGGAYYWPKSDNNHGIDFIFTAYSQFDGNVEWANDTLKVNVPEISQSLINNPDNFNDVLWAQTSYNHHQDGNVGAEHERVNLNFKHALSWIQFNAKVADNNASIKWVKIDTVKFGSWQDAQTIVTPGAMVSDTTDTWLNLRRSSNVDGSPSKTAEKNGENWGAYVDNFEIPAALVSEIKSYYSINGGTAGEYDLHMGNSVWPSAEIRKLRIVKDIPEAYKLPVERPDGKVIVFFDALKYLENNGYKMAPRNSGGKPAIFDYPIIDMFVNGTSYTVVGFNYSVSSVYDANVAGNIPTIEYTIEQTQQTSTTYIPAKIKVDSLAVAGTLTLPTNVMANDVLLTNGEKVAANLNFAPNAPIIYGVNYEGQHNVVLSNMLVLPQAVPQYVTVIFDICIANAGGDEIVFTSRRITRKINEGMDADGDAQYVAYWASSNKYIYNFNFDGDMVDFNTTVANWETNVNNYHVWDY